MRIVINSLPENDQYLNPKFDIIIPPQDISCAPGLHEKLAKGDREAFAWVYKNYCQRIYHYVLLMTGDATATEDIVQDVFIRLWQHKEKLASFENFNGYLYSLAKNYTLNVLRGEKRRTNLHHVYASLDNGDVTNYESMRLFVTAALQEIPAQPKKSF